MAHPTIHQLKQFREGVYQGLKRSADAVMKLIDALSGQTRTKSVAELSLEPGFEREYSSVYPAIADFEVKGEKQKEKEKALLRVIANTVSEPERNGYWLFGTDGTPASRPYAWTMEDRSFVYQPNVVRGNKPVTIGHSYSVLGHLPEKGEGGAKLDRAPDGQAHRDAGDGSHGWARPVGPVDDR